MTTTDTELRELFGRVALGAAVVAGISAVFLLVAAIASSTGADHNAPKAYADAWRMFWGSGACVVLAAIFGMTAAWLSE